MVDAPKPKSECRTHLLPLVNLYHFHIFNQKPSMVGPVGH
jgi:hypothetical protein